MTAKLLKTHGRHIVILISALISIIINTALIIWVIRLSAKHCGCIGGWRQDFIKYFAGFTILIGIFRLINSYDVFNFNINLSGSIPFMIGFAIIFGYFIASLINIYAVITYVDDVNKTECACAIKEMSGLNKSMIVLRWIYIAGLCLFGILFLYSLFRVRKLHTE